MTTPLHEAKQLLQAWWNFEDVHEKDSMQTVIPLLDPEWNWKGFDPVNALDSLEAYQTRFRAPFRKAFPSLKREVHLMLGGFSNGRVDGAGDGELWVCGSGLFHGFLQREWLGIPAAETPIHLRWADFHQIRDERILRSFMLVDLVDLLEQLGILLLPESLGKSGIYPVPKTHDGIHTEPCDESQTASSMKLIREFLFEGLNQFDQCDLQSMGVKHYFREDVQWYGPGGIGACEGLGEFEDFHQKPWLEAYPDRKVQSLDSLIAEGNYTAASGWSGVEAVHSGSYLGVPATENKIRFNGMDFWRREEEQFVENWVFVDMIHLFRQFGVDLLQRIPERDLSNA